MKTKNIYIALVAVIAMMTMSSCEKDLPLYDTDTCRLNFYYSGSYDYKQTLGSFSFINGPADTEQDTVWVEVQTMGFVRNYDRKVSFEQIDTTGVEQAKPGVHYVAFDDPGLAKHYVIPAGKARTKLPIVVKRDASLKKGTYVLRYRIKANEEFLNGYDWLQVRSLDITDRLARPSLWNSEILYGGKYAVDNFVGSYGTMKHQIMIDATGLAWDDKFIEELSKKDNNYLSYIFGKIDTYFEKLCDEREAKGLEPLKEDDGTVVSFESHW